MPPHDVDIISGVGNVIEAVPFAQVRDIGGCRLADEAGVKVAAVDFAASPDPHSPAISLDSAPTADDVSKDTGIITEREEARTPSEHGNYGVITIGGAAWADLQSTGARRVAHELMIVPIPHWCRC